MTNQIPEFNSLIPINGIEFLDWDLIDYEEALQKQEELVQQVASEKIPGVIVFCSHPHIVTLGRKTQAGDVFAWDGPVKEISRGGRATYHGPSQLLIYPILNLDLESNPTTHQWPKHDIGYLLRNLENAIVNTLAIYKIEATGKTYQPHRKKDSADDNQNEETGVWIGDKKIASLGISVKNWVSYHGAAINLDFDPKAFQGMNPCGFSKDIMTSIETQIGRKIDREEFKRTIMIELLKLF